MPAGVNIPKIAVEYHTHCTPQLQLGEGGGEEGERRYNEKCR